MTKIEQQFPVYIISKGRHDVCHTAKFMLEDGVNFNLVIEPQEFDLYKKYFPEKYLRVLPFSNLGQGSIPARNWCWEDSISKGHKKHWIFDDNIKWICRFYEAKRIRCNAILAMKSIENFVYRYENIGIAGMNYTMFIGNGMAIRQNPKTKKDEKLAFYLNTRVYSSLLIENSLNFRWRGRYNEDTDLCLQALSKKYCTVLFNMYSIMKLRTMTMKGGNSTELYKENGRLLMSKSLEKMWPGVVETRRKYGRAQHHVNWSKFDHPLIKRKDIDWNQIKQENGFENLMKLNVVKKPKSKNISNIVDKYREKNEGI